VRPSPTGTNRGSISFGTFTRANVCMSVTGSRTITPSDSDRLEMYGNGRPSPTASGFSIPASIWSCRPATRTMKNSSRLEE
jgi:hypothetical protein